MLSSIVELFYEIGLIKFFNWFMSKAEGKLE